MAHDLGKLFLSGVWGDELNELKTCSGNRICCLKIINNGLRIQTCGIKFVFDYGYYICSTRQFQKANVIKASQVHLWYGLQTEKAVNYRR